MIKTPKVLHKILIFALEKEARLKKTNASPEELQAAHAAVGQAMQDYDEAGFDPLEASVPHKTRYAHRMHGGLLGWSVAEEWHEAVTEWRYNRQCGYSHAQLVCDLCLCSKVQYWFVIENKLNGKRMRIGSECIQNWHSPGIITAIMYDRKDLEKQHKKELRCAELKAAAQHDPWLQARLPKLLRTVEKYGRVFDEAEDRVRAALGKPPLKGRSAPAEASV